ncbi:SMI1/KNR4 family protein [Phocoenobacter skyensis]|uniref:SMI1/KNR4 family protein n=1 Tax=Phocoenobacter skyensis TaxID=97481 RepID=A0A1H7VS61_9PAST|nr:SMI1/KNR4 family protein [Pasteurella skyensis]MDP8078889.1 SMI1/KNR4 family protein [Pasteurella skyensis]MDP8084798.1 SMI1/KNR4 family protein [Pasteurella skyensis]MDP8184862.1 SMI1/KNR4 family protein [Pasteurella skyensis]QLB22530.1 hypothetical protein A6B44_04660 [Pasteurella skyensis]SEM11675.1 hypothetical protein SAMN05444853_10581 [Pasteurella skyensis]
MEEYKPTPTAIFDKELFLWKDGKIKKGKHFGTWDYYDLDGKLIIKKTFNQQEKIIKQEFFPPVGIDDGVVLEYLAGSFIWVKYPAKDKDDFNNGTQKEWRLAFEDKPLDTKIFKGKSLEQSAEIWQKSAWFLKELYYENGFLAWIKLYDVNGKIIDFVEYESEDEESDEDLIKRLKKLLSVKNKTIVKNYKEYLELCCEDNDRIKNAIKVYEKVNLQDVKEIENRLHIILPKQVKSIYETYANGVDFEYGFEIFSTKKIVGLIDYFKFLQDDGFINNEIFDEICDDKYLQFLNNNFFVFAQKKVNADFFIMLFSSDGLYFVLDYSDDYSHNIYSEYLQNFEKTKSYEDLSILWNEFLRIEKINQFNIILEDYELYNECVEYEEFRA